MCLVAMQHISRSNEPHIYEIFLISLNYVLFSGFASFPLLVFHRHGFLSSSPARFGLMTCVVEGKRTAYQASFNSWWMHEIDTS